MFSLFLLVWIEACCDLLASSNGGQFRSLLAAAALNLWATCRIGTAYWRIRQIWWLTWDGSKPSTALFIQTWYRLEESNSVRMRGSLEDLFDRGRFDDMPGIHYVYVLACACDNT